MSIIRFNKKKAKFFCEFCGNEVKQNDKVCTYCGKFFASVRCPNCGKTGRTEEFTNGCPACGYAVHGTRSRLGLRSRNKNGNLNTRNRKGNAYDGSLPVWIYIAVSGVLVACLVGLYGCL